METFYKSYNHRDLTFGYQNVDTAKQFAKFVTDFFDGDDLIDIVACDGSSTFLAAFCKNLRPNWNFVSIDRNNGNPYLKGYLEKEGVVVFVDDYFAAGRATRDVVASLTDIDKLYCFYIDASEYVAETIAKIVNNKFPFEVNVMHKKSLTNRY